jgi:hypothetical protein
MFESTIELNQVVDTTQKKEIKTLDELLQHVAERQAYFISTLAAVLHEEDRFTGWQSIEKNPDDSVEKWDIEGEQKNGIFTGQYWCVTAAVAIGEALQQIVKKNNLQIVIEIANIDTDFYAENGVSRVLKDTLLSHTILKITDQNKKSYFIDPTYAQVDHRFSGKIVIIPESQYDQLYKTNKTTKTQFEPLDTFPEKQDAKALLLPERYQRLMGTLE